MGGVDGVDFGCPKYFLYWLRLVVVAIVVVVDVAIVVVVVFSSHCSHTVYLFEFLYSLLVHQFGPVFYNYFLGDEEKRLRRRRHAEYFLFC